MTIPPRHGEGDHAQHGGGVFATTRQTIKFAREQRRSGNLPEVVLWRALRQRPGGYRFRRQHPIGHYVLDTACLAARFAIEVDGESHDRGDRPYRDAVRDAALTRAGFRTLRLPAAAVLVDLDAAIRAVVAACDRPLHHPAAPDGPPPRAGEV